MATMESYRGAELNLFCEHVVLVHPQTDAHLRRKTCWDRNLLLMLLYLWICLKLAKLTMCMTLSIMQTCTGMFCKQASKQTPDFDLSLLSEFLLTPHIPK